jgi:hypothetical protein
MSRLFIGTSAKIHLWKVRGGYTFQPDNILFELYLGFNISDNIQVGFRHFCQHPIKCWNVSAPTTLEYWYEEIYISFKYGSAD